MDYLSYLLSKNQRWSLRTDMSYRKNRLGKHTLFFLFEFDMSLRFDSLALDLDIERGHLNVQTENEIRILIIPNAIFIYYARKIM